ncbi:MAG: ATP-dependent Clp protease ATP-binding subunit [Alphaproteobacteria bacterium]|nr:ATP-dependent Clp protease ATP-binding subunit [Alphaproteobacteria bacterium SS10]
MSNLLVNRTRFFRALAHTLGRDMADRRRERHDMVDLMLALARTQGSAPLTHVTNLDIRKAVQDLEDIQTHGRPRGLTSFKPVKSVRANLAHQSAQVVRALSQHIDNQLKGAGAYAYYAKEIVDDAITTFEQQERIAFEGKRPAKPEDVARLVALNAAIERERAAGVDGSFPRAGLTVPQDVIDEVREAAKEMANSPLSILMAVEKGPDTVDLANIRRVMQAFDGQLLDIISTRNDRALAGTITATETKMPQNDLQKIIATAVNEASNTGSSQLEPRHLFLALLTQPEIANEINRLNSKAMTQSSVASMQEALGRREELVGQPIIPGVRQTPSFKRAVGYLRPLFQDGRPKAKSNAVQTLLRSQPEIVRLLEDDAGLTPMRRERWLEISQTTAEQTSLPPYKITDEAFKEALDKFTVNVTDKARAGDLPPIIGRDDELAKIKRIMTHADKKNPIVTGDPGVGKTALLEGYAQAVVDGDVPGNQIGAEVYELKLDALISGTKYRGDFEERLRNVIQGMAERNARGDGRYVIGIDEAHQLVGLGQTRGGTQDASNTLKTYLQEGDLRTMLFTTRDEYAQHLEKDGALVRRTQPVHLNEPDIEDTYTILEGVKRKYERHYELEIPSDVVADAVYYGERYAPQRKFPDKGVEILDSAGAIAFAAGKPTVDRAAVVQATAELGGLPAEFLGQEDDERYAQLGEVLKGDVFGQDEAINRVAFALATSKAGLREPNKPIGSYLFVGPTGVGKTELTRALAKRTAGSADDMVRLDMSEFMEKHSVSKLIGAPPGYVGFDQEGLLTGPVRERPYTVLLLDEIEKAHPDVMNVLLQVMDNGKLKDGNGRTVDFSNTLIVMTSNLGAAEAQAAQEKEPFGFGTGAKRETPTEIMMEAVKRHFTPEFRNRLDATVPFYQLGREHMRPILDANIQRLQNQLRQTWSLEMVLGETDREQLIEEGFNPVLGARPLKRALSDMVEQPLAMWLLKNSQMRERPGSTLVLDGIGKDFGVTAESPAVPEGDQTFVQSIAARLGRRRTGAPDADKDKAKRPEPF